jgi:hypothetical protein
MKNHAVFFCVLLIVFAASCHSKAKRAKQYRDNILQAVQVVIDSSLNYGDGIQTYKKSKAIYVQHQYFKLIEQTIEKIKAQSDFEGDTTLAYYSLEMLAFYKNSLDKEFSPFLNAVKQETFTSEEQQTADSLYSAFAMMENKYWERFNWAEKKFYKENEIAKVDK